MTSEEMLRERVARLEVQMEHIGKKLDEQTEILKRLDAAFEQAKGAKWMLLAAASLVGFLSAKAGSIATWFGFVKGG
jgi:hypothetical protein